MWDEKRRMWDLLKHNTLELDTEEKIDYNDLAELILDESTHVKLKEKALDSNTNGQEKNSRDHRDPDDPYVRLKRDCVAIMAAFKFKEPYEHYVIVANSHIYCWGNRQMLHQGRLQDNLKNLKRLFSTYEECLIIEDLVEKEAETVEGVVA
nr:DNAse I-like superfamily protein [Tanacetum cinerariifolium]